MMGSLTPFAARTQRVFLRTIEFFPEEGKYHLDGHRNCKARLTPEETLRRKGLCPVCAKPVTIGVMHRVDKLADRDEGAKPRTAIPYDRTVPLVEILAQVHRVVGVASQKVQADYFKLLSLFGNELYILRELPLERLEEKSFSLLAVALKRMREGAIEVSAGYDGEYGTISLLEEKDFQHTSKELLLF